jgi:peptidoglycan hydrolase-like protein with peptidoglycan-binding domain
VSEGDSGDYVKLVQIRLKELGLYNGYIDSYFGHETLKAVKCFQERADLYPDGVANKLTWAKLNASQIPVIISGFKEGRSEVITLQKRLKTLGYYKGGVDGVFKFATIESVKAFQLSVGLIPDGVVGPVTWEELENACGLTVKRQPLKAGSVGGGVMAVQEALKKSGYYSGGLTGEFDGDTERAVQMLQADKGLQVNGVVEDDTWIALYDAKKS